MVEPLRPQPLRILMFSQFIKERKYLRNVSPRTLEWYGQSFKWLAVEHPSEDDLKSFVIRMREAGLAASSCNNRIRAVRAYLRWQGSHLELPYMKEVERVIQVYAPGDVRKFIAFRPKTFPQQRLQVLVLMLLDTGVRIEEALTLDWPRCDLDDLLLTVMGKGGKERRVPFSFELRRELYRYQQKCEFRIVFATRSGRRLRRRNVLRDFASWCGRLGVAIVPRAIHALRHTFAINYVQQGGSVFHLQKMLGHSSLKMSQVYARVGTANLQEIHQKVSILNRLR